MNLFRNYDFRTAFAQCAIAAPPTTPPSFGSAAARPRSCRHVLANPVQDSQVVCAANDSPAKRRRARDARRLDGWRDGDVVELKAGVGSATLGGELEDAGVEDAGRPQARTTSEPSAITYLLIERGLVDPTETVRPDRRSGPRACGWTAFVRVVDADGDGREQAGKSGL